jgi:hypothetical protein
VLLVQVREVRDDWIRRWAHSQSMGGCGEV